MKLGLEVTRLFSAHENSNLITSLMNNFPLPSPPSFPSLLLLSFYIIDVVDQFTLYKLIVSFITLYTLKDAHTQWNMIDLFRLDYYINR